MKIKSYYQGGGGVNEPTPGKPKYKKEPVDQKDITPRGVFFRNYDLYDTGDPTPGTGLYSHMDKYKNVIDFRKKKRKASIRNRRKNFLKIIAQRNYDYGKGLYQNMDKFKSVQDFETKKDELLSSDTNDLDDPTEGEVTPIVWNPAEPGGSSLGLLDGIYPKEDLEDTPVTDLYYGRTEMHRIEAQKK